ncbi:MAG: hypothetical protein ACOY0T_00140 [Myxococcota bacterium]
MKRLAQLLALACFALLAPTLRAAEPNAAALGPDALNFPVLEQEVERGILTPVPIDISLPASVPAARVLVHYKIFGSKEWTTLSLTRRPDRWSGAIPCLEVSTITGDILYYIRVHDADGAMVAFSGSRHQPYRVRIVYAPKQEGEQRGRCAELADCPPGLPGCPSEKVERIPCKSDRDCEGGQTCGWDGYCEVDTRTYNWLSIDVEGGLGVVSATGACSIPSQENNGYLCYRERSGDTYLGNPLYTNESLAVGTAPLRATLGYERLIEYSTTLGVRFGYAFAGSGPTARQGTAFMPLSGELRLSHYWGSDPFRQASVLPFTLLVGGYGMYDVHTHITVHENVTHPSLQGGNDLVQKLEVWKRAGDAFVGIGGGILWRIGPRFGVTAELRAVQAFPFGASLLLASVGARSGF